MAKTKYFVKKGSEMANFLCIFVHLKWMAPDLGWWENSEIFWELLRYMCSHG